MKKTKSAVPDLGQVTPPVSLSHTAKETLKKAIVKGELRPGSVYSEQAVAAQMGISKTPVHHALMELEEKGFVNILPRRGFVVNRFSRQELSELFEYRRALECAVVANLAANLTPQGKEQLEELVHRFLHSEALSEFMSLDRLFHEKLAELSGNRYLIKSLSNIWDMVEWLGMNSLRGDIPGGYSADRKSEMDMPREEHKVMLKAIIRSDPVMAQEAMLNHLRRTEKKYLDMWEDLNIETGSATEQ
jgi:DNA-binding GntR family transcriptional regulator